MAELRDNTSRQADEHDGTSSEHVPGPASRTAESAPAVPRGLSSAGRDQRRKLILHVDLNNTILVSDVVQSQSTVAALDYYLTTVTWGRMGPKGKWEWVSDAPSLLPPCEGAVNFYTQFGGIAGFTAGAGRRFRGVLEEHLNLLCWPEGVKGDRELSIKGEDGRLYHWILPSFFQMLRDLVHEGRDFAVVFRTFGCDLPRVLRVMSKVLTQGAHPLFPDLAKLKLSVNMTPGKIRCSKKGIVVNRGEERVSSQDGERGLYQYFSSAEGVGGFQDQYDWWTAHNFSIRGGKPIWVDPFDQHVQHIFFDDNLRQNDEDTVVHPKVFLEPGGTETRTAAISELYDLTLVQNDLLKAISDPNYFTHRIRICEENYEGNLQQVSA